MKKRNIIWGIILTIFLSFAGCSALSEPSTDTVSTQTGGTESEKKELRNNAQMEVHFIDVGQGDSTLIVCDGKSMLIDAGNNDKGTAVQMYLQKQGIKRLDYVIGTHPDADHIGGLDVVLYKFDCETVILPDSEKDTKTYDDVIQTMKRKNNKKTLPVIGKEYQLGSGTFTIISPNQIDNDNANNNSVGILLHHGNSRFLLAGDVEKDAEKDILNGTKDISADVYKVSHHGSETASTQPFLDEMMPKYAVISCGKGNAYGHPHHEVLDRLQKMGVKVFRTDVQGTVIAKSDGKSITWNSSPNASSMSNTDSANSTEHEEMAYVINTNTKKFHIPTCSSVEDMKSENRKDSTSDRDEMMKQGYTPCGKCKP